MGYTKEDVLRIAKEKDVKFIRLQFTDIFGQLKNVAITASQLEKALDNECMFDGSSKPTHWRCKWLTIQVRMGQCVYSRKPLA